MKAYRINGGNKLSGEINPVGNKNSVLKLIAASILFKGDYVLENVPGISDVPVMLEIINALGGRSEYYPDSNKVVINTDSVNTTKIPAEYVTKVRASVVFIGPLLARFGKVETSFPGGDKIGPRELKAHFASLIQMGYSFSGNEWGEFSLAGENNGGHIHMFEPSVTATENLIMAAAISPHTTVITGAACEPHVKELSLWLSENGVSIEGIGSSILKIKGTGNLLEAEGRSHSIWTDYIDVSTAAVSAAITGGELTINNVRYEDLKTIEFFYSSLGLELSPIEENKLHISANQKLVLKDKRWGRVKGVYSQPWFGFPSDLMSITIVLAMYVKGMTLFFEKLYPDRMAFVSAFNDAGANIIISDPHRIVVNGPTELKGRKYHAPDLRAGMAYFLASLAADGVSTITGVEHIERGYPNSVERYKALGAEIELIES